jgi:hypothetical protein
MKKLLLVFDGRYYPETLLRFVLRIREGSAVSVRAVLLNSTDMTALWSFPVAPGTGAPYVPPIPDVTDEAQEAEANADRITQWLKDNNLSGTCIRQSEGPVFETIKKESRFADIMLLCGDHFFAHFGHQPNDYLKQTLHISECAMILVPDNAPFPERTVMAYDGSAASVYAIRQLAYLLPEMCNLPATFLHAGEGGDVPYAELIVDLAERWYPNAHWEHLLSSKRDQLSEHLAGLEDGLVVCGAFERGVISQFFRDSTVSRVIKSQNVPLFIAHH